MTTASQTEQSGPAAPRRPNEKAGLTGMQFKALERLAKGEQVSLFKAGTGNLRPADGGVFHRNTFNSLIRHGFVQAAHGTGFVITDRGRSAFEALPVIDGAGVTRRSARYLQERAIEPPVVLIRSPRAPVRVPRARRVEGLMGLTVTQCRALAWLIQGETVTVVVQNIEGARRSQPGATHLNTIRSLIDRGFIVEQPQGRYAITDAGRHAYDTLPLTG